MGGKFLSPPECACNEAWNFPYYLPTLSSRIQCFPPSSFFISFFLTLCHTFKLYFTFHVIFKELNPCVFAFEFPQSSKKAEHVAGDTHLRTYIQGYPVTFSTWILLACPQDILWPQMDIFGPPIRASEGNDIKFNVYLLHFQVEKIQVFYCFTFIKAKHPFWVYHLISYSSTAMLHYYLEIFISENCE